MRSQTTLLRSLRFLALLVQVALPALGGLADAHLELDALDARTHIESTNHDCDERGHPELCAICHFLRTMPAQSGEQPAVVVARQREPVTDAFGSLTGSRQHSPSLPRGPPALS